MRWWRYVKPARAASEPRQGRTASYIDFGRAPVPRNGGAGLERQIKLIDNSAAKGLGCGAGERIRIIELRAAFVNQLEEFPEPSSAVTSF